MNTNKIPTLLLLILLSTPLVVGLQLNIDACKGQTVKTTEEFSCLIKTNDVSAQLSLSNHPDGMEIVGGNGVSQGNGLLQWTSPVEGTYENINITGTNATANQSDQFTLDVQPAAPGSLRIENIILGSTSQNDIDQIRNQQLTRTITFNNTGDSDVTNITATAAGIHQDYSVTINSVSKTTLQGGESGQLTIGYTIPGDQDSGSESIPGNIRIRGDVEGSDSQTEATATLTAEAPSALQIVDDEIEVEVGSDDDTLSDGDTHDEDAQLGDEITVTFEVENLFDDIDVEELEVSLDSSDIDTADGIDEEIDIDAGDEEEVEFTFTLDEEDIDPSDAPFEVELQFDNAEDENGAAHDIADFTFEIDMDVEDEDLRILESSIGEYRLSCNSNRVVFDARVRNVGEDDLDEAMVQFEVDDLGISEFVRNINIDEGDSEDISTSYRFDERPNTGTYIVDITAYHERSTNSDTDRESTSLVVEECTVPDEEEEDDSTNGGTDEEEDNDPIVIERPPSTEQPQVPGTPVVSEPGTPVEDTDDTFIYVLAGLVGVLIITTGWVITRIVE